MTEKEKEKAIEIIKNIIDYNGIEPWGRALRYAVKELEEKLTSDNSDYAKCADDILKLDSVDAVVNKHGCLVAILKRHFA